MKPTVKNMLFALLAIIIFPSTPALAQYQSNYDEKWNQASLGIGFGLGYSGILGANFSYCFTPYISVTGQLGVTPVRPGLGAGMNFYLIPKDKSTIYKPNLKIQYGYTSMIWVLGKEEYNDVFYGARFALGNEFRFGRARRHGFDFDLFYSILSDEYHDKWEIVNNDPDVEGLGKVYPVTISLGYHFDF
ncbi:hypothetical protein [Reichenbachiella ulvae]|uniref:Outer membrane protein beta-barrel domain-containing protein n=1 Tax=Reichenbachiella ulvae TaxID=2980104 RepID=A0ABT3CWA6_9BACT|nr:hypothetical protein [Reichenbachiella ulvae]MCV9387833.1 hypothetical protein [Reichenbachiella ulvae]